MKKLSLKKLFENMPVVKGKEKDTSFEHGYNAAKTWYEKGYKFTGDNASQSPDPKAFAFGVYTYEVEHKHRLANSSFYPDEIFAKFKL